MIFEVFNRIFFLSYACSWILYVAFGIFYRKTQQWKTNSLCSEFHGLLLAECPSRMTETLSFVQKTHWAVIVMSFPVIWLALLWGNKRQSSARQMPAHPRDKWFDPTHDDLDTNRCLYYMIQGVQFDKSHHMFQFFKCFGSLAQNALLINFELSIFKLQK